MGGNKFGKMPKFAVFKQVIKDCASRLFWGEHCNYLEIPAFDFSCCCWYFPFCIVTSKTC